MDNLYTKTVSAGFAHTAAIFSNKDKDRKELHCWGDNSNQEIKPHKNNNIDPFFRKPQPISLPWNNNIFDPLEVSCGTAYTLVLAQQQGQKCLTEDLLDDPEHKKALKDLRKEIEDDIKSKEDLLDVTKLKIYQIFVGDGKEETAANKDTYEIQISKEDFEKVLKSEKYKLTNTTKLQQLFVTITKNSSMKETQNNKEKETVLLGDIEDFVLGFRQNNVKCFLFGYCHNSLKVVESKKNAATEGETGKTDAKEGVNQNLLQNVRDPTVICFPKYAAPIIQIACGADHALALTIYKQIYSWGSSDYGCLGHGQDQKSPLKPKLIEIRDHKNEEVKVIQIVCGKYHSMALSERNSVYSWGKGLNGQLGHGDNEEDKYIPHEIKGLSMRKPIFISAGDNHSAAISENHNLFTWGNGGFGRLGHDNDNKELKPKLVDAIVDQKIVYVSAGAFHTLAVDDSGNVWAFGQNKYGKLGIFSDQDDKTKQTDSIKIPKKISMFKLDKKGNNSKWKSSNDKVIKVLASVNHSCALTQKGLLFTWGYKGKGLLGRDTEFNQNEKVICSSHFAQLVLYNSSSAYNPALVKFQEYFYNQQISYEELKVDRKKDNILTHFVQQVACSHYNTVALSNKGDVLVLGSNQYHQHCRQELPKPTKTTAEGQKMERPFIAFNSYSRIEFPMMNQVQIILIACGGEHIFAKSQLDEVYGWGRNDEGQLGCGYLTDKISTPKKIEKLRYKAIKQIECGDNFSAALTLYGEVFVAGSLENGKLGLGKGKNKGFQLYFEKVNIETTENNQTRGVSIDSIACGVQHMLAISRYIPSSNFSADQGKTFAWGKNDKGQLGIGSKNTCWVPTPIEFNERFKKVACGHNYSFGLTTQGRLYFWGNLRYFSSNKQITDLEDPMIHPSFENYEIKDIACNFKYCVVYWETFTEKNLRYLGKFLMEGDDKKREEKPKQDDEEENKKAKSIYQPQNIQIKGSNSKVGKDSLSQKSAKVRMISIGTNHVAIINQSDQERIYTWGYNNSNNRLGLDEAKSLLDTKANILPCKVINDYINEQISKAQINFQGQNNDFFDDQDCQNQEDQSASEEPEEEKVQARNTKLPRATIDGDRKTEIPKKSVVPEQPQDIKDERNIIQDKETKKKEKKIQAAKVEIQEGVTTEDKSDITIQIRDFNEKAAKKNDKDKPKGMQVDLQRDLNELCIFDRFVGLEVLDFIIREQMKKELPQIKNITSQPISGKKLSIMDQNFQLQMILKTEELQGISEAQIVDLDSKMKKQCHEIIRKVLNHAKSQFQLQELKRKAASNMLSKITENPFKVDTANQYIIKNNYEKFISKQQKKVVQKVLRLIHLHPCYLLKLLQSKNFQTEDKKLLIKQLFPNNNRMASIRNSYLLISIYEELLEHELKLQKEEGIGLDSLQLCQYNSKAKDDETQFQMISTFIFEHIFDSHPTNLDTIVCIVCHIINTIQVQFQQASSDDVPFDVNEEKKVDLEKEGANKKNKSKANVAAVKSAAAGSEQNKGQKLALFIKQVVSDIKDNKILKENAQWFSFRKQTENQLSYIKKQFKLYQLEEKANNANENNQGVNKEAKNLAGIDAENVREKYPSLRFTDEVYLMINILYKQLLLVGRGGSDDQIKDINKLILGMIFKRPMDTVWADFKSYLYPYNSKAKLLPIIVDEIDRVHEINIKNAILAFNCCMTGGDFKFPPKEEGKSETQIIADLNETLKSTFNDQNGEIMKKIKDKCREVTSILSYMNFENQLCHSLELGETRVCMSKKLIGKLFDFLQNSSNQKEVALSIPAENDNLINALVPEDQGAQQGTDLASQIAQFKDKPNYQEKVNLKIKSRLFVPRVNITTQMNMSEFVRCKKCNATLLQEIAVQNFDENILLPIYEPLDRESIVSIYCEIIKLIKENISKDPKKQAKLLTENDESVFHQDELKYTKDFASFLEKENFKASRTQDNEMKKLIQNFKYKLKIEIQSYKDPRQSSSDLCCGSKISLTQDEYDLISKSKEEDDQLKKMEGILLKDKDKILKKILKEGKIILQILDTSEKKYIHRVNQKFSNNIIEKQMNQYLLPHLNARISQFNNEAMEEYEMLKKNCFIGLGNQKLTELAIKNKWDELQINVIKKEVTQISQGLTNLTDEQRKNIKGYLQIDCKTLRQKLKISGGRTSATIVDIQLQELKDLIEGTPYCWAIMIENDEGGGIEFKMVFRETVNPCFGLGGSHVVQEHILLNFDITANDIKKLRAKIAENKQNSQNPSGTAEENYTFEGNDSISFNPELFLKLISKMEKQKLAALAGGGQEAN